MPHKFLQKYLLCKHLAAQCLYEAQMYSEALHLLKNDHIWNGGGPIQVSLTADEPLSPSQQQSVCFVMLALTIDQSFLKMDYLFSRFTVLCTY